MKYAVPVQQYMMATVTRYICQGTARGCAKLLYITCRGRAGVRLDVASLHGSISCCVCWTELRRWC